MIPKVNIVLGKVEEYSELLNWVFLDNNMFKDSSFSKYTGLKKIIDNSSDKEKSLKDYFKKIEKEKLEELKNSTKEIQQLWMQLSDKAMKAFEEIHETKWTKKHELFTVRVTLCPVCPRWLNDNTFDVSLSYKKDFIIEIFFHELSHFIFFESFKKIYPKIYPEKFEDPHLIWKLSEIIPGIILRDKRIQNIFPVKNPVYDFIEKIEINGELILDIFQEFYDNKKDFTDFVKKSYEFVKKHEDEINKHFK